MTNIVERPLIDRLRGGDDEASNTNLTHEAADLIESLQARVKEQDAIIAEHNADMWVQGENYAVLSCQCAEANARVKELEAELLSALAQAEHNGNELAASAQRIVELETKLADVWELVDEFRDENSAQRRDLAAATKRIAELKRDAEGLRAAFLQLGQMHSSAREV